MNEFKFTVQVSITIKKDITVGRVVVSTMIITEVLAGEFRNGIWMTSRRKTIGIVGKKVLAHVVIQLVKGIGKSSLHFIVNHTLDNDRRIGGIQFIMPAFLFQDHGILVHHRLENGIKIHMHQVKIIFQVHAGHRIGGMVRGSHCIQKGMQRTFQEDVERTSDRKIFGSVQY